MMNLIKLIEENIEEIIKDCVKKIDRMGLEHYQEKDAWEVEQRIRDFFEALEESIKFENPVNIVSFAKKTAEERYYAGYSLSEVQTAFNCIEKVLWKKTYHELPAADFAKAISLISTIMGSIKDRLARKYYSLLKKTRILSRI